MKKEDELKQKLERLLSPLNAIGPGAVPRFDDWLSRDDIGELITAIDGLSDYAREAKAARELLVPTGKAFVESPPLEIDLLREFWCEKWGEYEEARAHNEGRTTWRT